MLAVPSKPALGMAHTQALMVLRHQVLMEACTQVDPQMGLVVMEVGIPCIQMLGCIQVILLAHTEEPQVEQASVQGATAVLMLWQATAPIITWGQEPQQTMSRDTAVRDHTRGAGAAALAAAQAVVLAAAAAAIVAMAAPDEGSRGGTCGPLILKLASGEPSSLWGVTGAGCW